MIYSRHFLAFTVPDLAVRSALGGSRDMLANTLQDNI